MERNIQKLAMLLVALMPVYVLSAPPIPQNLPSSIDAGVVSEQFKKPQIEPQTKTSHHPPTEPVKTKHLPNADRLYFVLTRVDFTDVTIFPTKELDAIFKPFYGKKISLAELESLVDAVTNKYRNAGYILSQAILPPQRIQKGIVKVRVIEGFVAQTKVEGKAGRALPLIQQYAEQVKNEKPLKVNTLERYALLANDIPGAVVRAVLNPSTTTTLGSDLLFLAEQKLFDGYVSVDNYGTKYLGPWQYTGGLNVNSLFTPGDLTSLRGVITDDPDQLRFIQLAHEETLGTEGLRLLLNGSFSETRPGDTLEQLKIVSRSRTISAGLSYPLIRSRTENWNIQGAFSYMNSDTSILEVPFYEDRIRNLKIGTTYDRADTWSGINSIGLNIEQGLRVMGATNPGNVDVSRVGGRSDYTKLNLQLSRLQTFTPQFSLFVAAQGQYSFNPLYSAQQFSYGGSDYGKGYDPSVIIGDKGVSAKTELRYTTTPNLPFLKAAQYYWFIDGGKIWNTENLSQISNAHAASSGIGTRLSFNPYFGAQLYAAKPLSLRFNSSQPAEKRRAWHVYMQASAYF